MLSPPVPAPGERQERQNPPLTPSDPSRAVNPWCGAPSGLGAASTETWLQESSGRESSEKNQEGSALASQIPNNQK